MLCTVDSVASVSGAHQGYLLELFLDGTHVGERERVQSREVEVLSVRIRHHNFAHHGGLDENKCIRTVLIQFIWKN